MTKRNIDQVDVAARRVLVRVDFNVPLDDTGTITDDRRIRSALPTVRSVLDRGGAAILMSHLGRPAGTGFEAAYSLEPVATRLRELMPGTDVVFVPGDCAGAEAQAAARALEPGQVLLLDNLRFHPGEKGSDPAFAATLAGYADVYVNDAFGTAHRADASMVGVPTAMGDRPRVAGLLLARELAYLGEAIRAAEAHGSGFVAILGGAKVSDKLAAIEHLLGRVDDILIGGAMAYTFLAAEGIGVGASRCEPEMFETARTILARARDGRTSVHLPGDHVVAERLEAGVSTRVVAGQIDPGWMGLDIGPETRTAYAGIARAASTAVWNGPMGVFEIPPFDAGTRAVAEALAEGGGVSIVGGGDSAAAIEQLGLSDRISHVSTGGGASLQMLEGRRFEAVEVLDEPVAV